jgi:hypothetical protein
MSQPDHAGATMMKLIGVLLAVVAAAMLVWGSGEATPAIVLGAIGIVFIAIGSRDQRSSVR